MLFRLFFVALILVTTQAFPSGPGSCKAGTAVGASHLFSKSKGAVPLTLTIGGMVVKPGTTLFTPAFSFAKGKSLVIKLSGRISFKGFQMRLASGTANTVNWLKKGNTSNVWVDNTCTAIKIGGICHFTPDSKTSVQGLISVPTARSRMKLQITVVVRNKAGVSEWYTSNYTLNAV